MSKAFFRSFAGGETTPEAFSRFDLTRVQTGLAKCRNFFTLPHGPAVNRAGTEYVREVKDSSKRVCLLPFIYNADQAYTLEMGDQYIRIHTEAATVLTGTVSAWVTATAYAVGALAANGGVSYYCKEAHTSGTFATDLAAGKWYALPADGVLEIPSPYLEADLFNIHYTQSADVLTLTCKGYAVREFQRLGATQWVLTTPAFDPTLSAPTGVAATNTVGTGSVTYRYVVTAVAEDGVEESVASSVATCTNNLVTTGNYNTVTWSLVSGAVRYNIYREGFGAGLYGYVGQATTGSFKDQNITPDVGQTPPEAQNLFPTDAEAPRAVGYYQGRRWFGGSENKKQNLWASRSGTESNMTRSIPTRDDDAITLRLRSRQAAEIRHIVPLSSLIVLTSEAEWNILAQNSDVLTAATADYKPQSYVGASEAQPVVTSSSVVFCSDRGAHLQELIYSWESQGYKTGDMSLIAPHLVDGYTIRQLTYARAPLNIVWAARSDGVLLGATYVPSQQVISWHQHDTFGGEVESVCAIPEGSEDMLYVSVKRTINGATKRYIERMRSRRFTALEECFFVDCGMTYDGAPATTISGLGHLEGEAVVALADGAVVRGLTVDSGVVTLPHAASKVHIGIPITADLETLPFAIEAEGYGQDALKNVNRVLLRVKDSSGIFAGPDYDNLREYKQRTTEPWGSPPNPVSGVIEVDIDGMWTPDGQVVIQQSDPLPLTVSSILLDFAQGG